VTIPLWIKRKNMMRAFIVGTLLIVAANVHWAADARPAEQALLRRAAAIKPTADELRWQQIPWIMDLAVGQRLARAERRPIFLWVTGDDPLERC
jgi:hypothetical protein